MGHALLADAVLSLHGLFIACVVAGSVAVCWRPVWAWLHLPAVAWGAWISFSATVCPLTPLEQSLRRAAGQAGYEGGFIERYLTAAIYPDGLTPTHQAWLGVLVLAINLVGYGLAWRRAARRRRIA
jgi:hypothetical protein